MSLNSFQLDRSMTAIFVGGILALSGLLLQTLLRNPLAESYTIGLSGGATFGATLFLSLGLGNSVFQLSFGAALGCLIPTTIILVLVSRKKSYSSESLILIGLMLTLFFGALSSLNLGLLTKEKSSTALNWLMGQVGTSRDVFFPASFIALSGSLFWSLKNHRLLDSWLLGEDYCYSIHFSPKGFHFKIILCVALMTAFATAQCGLIGFVGLIAPHSAKKILTSNRHKGALILTPIIGAQLLLASDILGLLLKPYVEVPTGSLISLIGAPILIIILLQRRRYA